MGKTLVAFFSAGGTTARAAKALAQAAGADLYEIKPDQPYTSADLDWMDKKSRSSVEMKDGSARPVIADRVENMDDYDTVFVGFPIWWYTAPRIVNTFLESYDFAGKTVIPFATSGGSGVEKSAGDLKAKYPGISWKKGKLLGGRVTADTLRGWID